MIKKVKDIALHDKDTGSSEVQIALLTEKIDSQSYLLIEQSELLKILCPYHGFEALLLF